EMGIMNIPVVQDERVTQNELNIIAMRKTIKFKINYYQQRMRDIFRYQLILVLLLVQIESAGDR
ncbi:hypothetical protein LUD21_28035, partial [Klebsiella pneumoniae]|nr:hypothetical protein [Klebsiella pneumoniae]